MKHIKLIILLCFCCNLSIAQKSKTAFSFQIKEEPYLRIFKNTKYSSTNPEIASTFYNLLTVHVGIETDINSKRINGTVFYGFNSNFKELYVKGGEYQSHLLGLSCSYFFNNEGGFFVSIDIASEIASNFHNQSITEYFDPGTPLTILKPYSGHNAPLKYYHESNFYQSSPFIGFVHAGYNFKITQAFHISLSAGYGLQIMKYKYLKWDEGEDYQEALRLAPVQTQLFHAIGLELGLLYSIPMKSKKEK